MHVNKQNLLWELIVALGISIKGNVAVELLEKWFKTQHVIAARCGDYP
jgi:NAD-dependent DNA ligase